MIGADITFDIVQDIIKFACLNGIPVKIIYFIDYDRCRNHMKLMFFYITLWQIAGRISNNFQHV